MAARYSVETDTIPELAAAAAALAAALGGTTPVPGPGPVVPGPTPTPGPVASDPNTYPLNMKPVVNPNDPVTLGVGPDGIRILIANSPTHPGTQFVVEATTVDGLKLLVDPLLVTSLGGTNNANSQLFTIKTTLKRPLTALRIIPVGLGWNQTWINAVSVNFIPWVVNGMFDARGMVSVNAIRVNVTANNTSPLTWTPAPAVVPVPVPGPGTPPAPPPATGTALPTTAIAAPLTLPAGRYVGSATIDAAIVVQGAGMGKTTIDCTGLRPILDKGVLVARVSGATIKNLTLKGAQIPAALGANAAGVRVADLTHGITLENVEISGCDNGFLGAGLTATGCDFHDNGAGGSAGGLAHNIYNRGTLPFVMTNSKSWNAGLGHAVKSRAPMNTLTGNDISGSIDFPFGGEVNITGCTFTRPNDTGDHKFLSFGAEAGANPTLPENATRKYVLNYTDCVFSDLTGTGGILKLGAVAPPGTPLNLVRCTYTGALPPKIDGFTAVTGTITKAV